MNGLRQKLLLIEDYRPAADLFVQVLALFGSPGFDVQVTDTLTAARDALAHGGVDVVIADLNLPDSQGLETCKSLCALAPDVPVIVLTGIEDETLALQAIQKGAQDYLIKGEFDYKLLKRVIRYAIERNRHQITARRLRKMEDEFNAASEIQKKLLPVQAPSLPGFDIAGRCQPAAATGGDYFDYIPMNDGRLGIVIGDVSGHGFGPALIMSSTRRLLRTLAATHSELECMLALANRAVLEDTAGARFVTLFFARLDPRAQTMVYASAGHEGFILSCSGAVKRIDATGPLLGMIEDSAYSCSEPVKLASGDLMVLLTDGFQEAQGPRGGWFGIDRVLAIISANRRRPASEILDRLYREVREFCDPDLPQDDLTAVIVRVES